MWYKDTLARFASLLDDASSLRELELGTLHVTALCVTLLLLARAINGTALTHMFFEPVESIRISCWRKFGYILNWCISIGFALSLQFLVEAHPAIPFDLDNLSHWVLFLGGLSVSLFVILNVTFLLTICCQSRRSVAAKRCFLDGLSRGNTEEERKAALATPALPAKSSAFDRFLVYPGSNFHRWVWLLIGSMTLPLIVPLSRHWQQLWTAGVQQMDQALSFTVKAYHVVAILAALIVIKWVWSRLFAGHSSAAKAQPRNAFQELHRAASYTNAPYPNGWYKVSDSWSLKRGEIKEIRVLGQVLVLYRTNDEEGRAVVLDAYCPHLGANLSVGGVVKGDRIACPFHEWEFDKDGVCQHIPYCDKVPEAAKTRSWPVVETLSMVCIYFDADGRAPSYQPLDVPEISSGLFTFRGAHDADPILMHIQEIAENSADFRHFDCLHGPLRIPWTNIRLPFARIIHKAQWLPQTSPHQHIALFRDEAFLELFGIKFPSTTAVATITFMGPSSLMYFLFEIPKVGNIILIQSLTPEEPLKQRHEMRWYADRNVPDWLVWYVVGNWISQAVPDLAVWENKIFSRKPVLVQGDGPVWGLRRWYRQFYSDNSAKLSQPFPQSYDW